MPVPCLSCDSEVTNEYARVLGDNDGNVYRCPACADKTITKGKEDVESLIKYGGM